MTIRDIGILFGFELDESSERNVESKVNSLKSFAAKALGAIGLTLSISGISSAITSCVSLASEVEEMENKFDVVFGNIRDEVDKWAESYADAVGRNKNDIKTYLADQQNLLVGFGMTREAGAKLSEEMTSLALDLASFGNMDEATSVDAMTKAVMGESEAAKTLGAVLNDSTRAQAMHTLGLSGTYEKLDQLTKMQVNYQAILSQSPDAIGDCERSLGSYESTVRRFESKLREVKQLIGQFFMPTFQKIISVGARGLTGIRDFAEWINKFAEEVGGAEQIIAVFTFAVSAMLLVMNAQKIYTITSAIIKFAKANSVAALSSLKLFAGFLLVALLIQDFIAFMRGDNSLLGAMLERAGVDCDKLRQNITKTFENIKKAISYIVQGIKNVVVPIFVGIKNSVVAVLKKIGEALKVVAPGIAQFFESLANGDADPKTFTQIGEVIGTVVAGIVTAIAAIKGANVITGIISTVIGAVSKLSAVFGIVGKIGSVLRIVSRFGSVLRVVISVVRGVITVLPVIASALGPVIIAIAAAIAISTLLYKNWDKIKEVASNVFESVKSTFGNLRSAVENGFAPAIAFIKSLPAQAAKWGADIVLSIISGITSKFDGVGTAVSAVAGKIKSFLHFSEPDEGPLSDFHTYMPDMMKLMAQGIISGKEKVKAALGNVTGDLSLMAKANIVSPKTVAGVNSSNISKRTITQNVNINNQFNGERTGQQKSSEAMDKASKDATGEMARALQMG